MSEQVVQFYRGRRRFVIGLLLIAAVLMAWRLFDLHILSKDFLQGGPAQARTALNAV